MWTNHEYNILGFKPNEEKVYAHDRSCVGDYYIWQNKSGVINLWLGWILNPFLMSTWIFASMHYWNSVTW